MRFEGRSREEADDRADAWLAANPLLRNVQMRATDARAGEARAGTGRRRAPKGGGRWRIELSFED